MTEIFWAITGKIIVSFLQTSSTFWKELCCCRETCVTFCTQLPVALITAYTAISTTFPPPAQRAPYACPVTPVSTDISHAGRQQWHRPPPRLAIGTRALAVPDLLRVTSHRSRREPKQHTLLACNVTPVAVLVTVTRGGRKLQQKYSFDFRSFPQTLTLTISFWLICINLLL